MSERNHITNYDVLDKVIGRPNPDLPTVFEKSRNTKDTGKLQPNPGYAGVGARLTKLYEEQFPAPEENGIILPDLKQGVDYASLVINVEGLEEDLARMEAENKEFLKLFNEFLEKYVAYNRNILRDRTSITFKQLPMKFKYLGYLEEWQREIRYKGLIKALTGMKELLTDLIGDGTERLLSEEEVTRYKNKAYDILLSIDNNSLRKEHTAVTDVMSAIDYSYPTTCGLFDILRNWEYCRPYIMNEGVTSEYKSIEWARRNGPGSHDELGCKAFKLFAQIHKNCKPTKSYVECMKAAEKLIPFVHGYSGEDTFQRVFCYRDGSVRRAGNLELLIRVGRNLVHFTNEMYPRDAESEWSIGAAAICILFALDSSISRRREEPTIRGLRP